MTQTLFTSDPTGLSIIDPAGTSRRAILMRRLILGAILVIAAAVRLRGLTANSFWYDESFTVHIVGAEWSKILKLVIIYENIPPLHYLLLKAWSSVAGISEWSMRVPSVAFGVISVWLLYRLTSYCISAKEGLIAAALLAFSEYHIYYSQEARSYMLMFMLALWSYDEFIRLLEEPRNWRRELRYVLATMLLFYSHPYGVFPVGVEIVYYLYRWLRNDPPVRLSARQFVTLQLAAWLPVGLWIPVYLFWHRTRAATFWISRLTAGDIPITFWHYTGWGNYFLFILVCALVVLGTARRDFRRWRPLFLTAMLLPVVVPVVESMFATPLFVPRYGITAMIGMFILAAAGIATLPRFGQWIITGLLALQLLLAPSPQYKEPWREVAHYLDQHMQSGDFLVMDNRQSRLMLGNYMQRTDIAFRGMVNFNIPLGLPLREESTHVWMLIARPIFSLNGYESIQAGNWRVCSQKRFDDDFLVIELADGQTESAAAYPDEIRFSAQPPTKDRTPPPRTTAPG